MNKPGNENTIDRSVTDIVKSMMLLVIEQKIKGQFARDLEKLCVIARMSKEYEQ